MFRYHADNHAVETLAVTAACRTLGGDSPTGPQSLLLKARRHDRLAKLAIERGDAQKAIKERSAARDALRSAKQSLLANDTSRIPSLF